MAKPDAETAAQREAAQLAAATYELWQEQWRLLTGDAEAQQNIQAMLELLGRNVAFWDQQIRQAEPGRQRRGDDAAKFTGAAPAAAASGAGGADLAQLAAAVAELAAKIDRIERRLEQQLEPGPAPKARRAAGKNRET
ncbi:MAG: hypothetical protein WBK91_07490 [Alphaproteobacteria bacterium]